MNWYLGVLKKYAVFSGRASRTEYWMFILYDIIIYSVFGFAGGLMIGFIDLIKLLMFLYFFATLIPRISLTTRRLHDTDRSGWWQLFAIIPLIGLIVLFVFLVLDSKPGSNRYGANPKDGIA